jgi:hypothetical protein
MRAKEFIGEKTGSLANMIRQAVVAQQGQQMGQPPAADKNQMKTGIQPQQSQGSQAPTQASASQTPSGGTQTPQNGTQPTQQSKPGVLGSFISGLTGGKANSLTTLGQLGAANLAGGAGLGSVKTSIDQSRQQNLSNPMDPEKIDPRELQTTLKPGTQLKHPELGNIKVNRITPQGIELDTSQSKQIGAKKITLDLKSLGQQR